MTEETPTKMSVGYLPREGDVIEGRYHLKEIVSRGGMGIIMRAEHILMQRDVAIKLMHPHILADEVMVARFERETQLATLFNHPNLVRVYDFGRTEEGVSFLVMELLEGEDLKNYLTRHGSLSSGHASRLMMQALEGLAEAHAQDVIHRDLKPSNLFVTRGRRGEEIVKV
ncbi:MAG: serine/threonine protein kinase, partial [Bradymonadaceae bacterium]